MNYVHTFLMRKLRPKRLSNLPGVTQLNWILSSF
jgi:hypothetical protein